MSILTTTQSGGKCCTHCVSPRGEWDRLHGMVCYYLKQKRGLKKEAEICQYSPFFLPKHKILYCFSLKWYKYTETKGESSCNYTVIHTFFFSEMEMTLTFLYVSFSKRQKPATHICKKYKLGHIITKLSELVNSDQTAVREESSL